MVVLWPGRGCGAFGEEDEDERKIKENHIAILSDEIVENYSVAVRRGIVNYILQDPAERRRIRVMAVPAPFQCNVTCFVMI